MRTIDQLTDSGEFGSFWVYATIISIENEPNWWYLSCMKCPKKVGNVGNKFYSEKCDRFDVVGNPRYKIEVRVIDGTGNASLLMWDRECFDLTGKTAASIRDSMTEVSSSNDEVSTPLKNLTKVSLGADIREGSAAKRNLCDIVSTNANKKMKSIIKTEKD